MVANKERAVLLLPTTMLIVIIIAGLSLEVQSQENDDYRFYLPTINYKTEWELECIECEHTTIADLPPRSADLDSEGQPHLVYGGEHLYYAYLPKDGDWEIEIVDPTPDVGSRATLALNLADHPHVIYKGIQSYRYAYHDGTEWHIENLPSSIDPSSGIDEYISLDIDSAGRPHISYIDNQSGSKSLMYAYRDEGVWHLSSLIHDTYLYPSVLVLDSMDQPHVVTADGEGIIYARFDGSAWVIENVAAAGWTASLALDSNDSPHIAVGPRVLEYLHKDESGWHLEVVDDGEESYFCQSIGMKPSIAIDDSGTPHINYYAYSSGNPYACERISHLSYHAYRSQSGWRSEYIRRGTSDGYSTILAESSSNVHIFYKYEDELRHMLKTDITWSETIIDRSRIFGSHISLVMDSSNKPYVSYFELESFRYNLATLITETWSIRALVSPERNSDGCIDCKSSLAMGPDNALQMTYQNNYRWRFQPVPAVYHIAFRESSEHDNLLNVCSSPGCIGLITVDSQNRPHVIVDGDLWIGEFDEINNKYIWTSEEIDILEQVESIAIDLADRPVIAGPSSGDSGVKYATKTDAGWISETVSDHYWVEGMALDPLGIPHFFVGSDEVYAASYLFYDGLNWRQEIFDDGGLWACDPSIVIDSDYGVHVAYSKGDSIMYAFRGVSGWLTPVRLDSGWGCSLALDSDGRTYIAYKDDHGDLRLRLIYQQH